MMRSPMPGAVKAKSSPRPPSLKSASSKLDKTTTKLAKFDATDPGLAKQIAALKNVRVCPECHFAQKDKRYRSGKQHVCPGKCESIAKCNHPLCRIIPGYVYKTKDARSHQREWLQLQQKLHQNEVDELKLEQAKKVSC
jgi:hypothetical protein